MRDYCIRKSYSRTIRKNEKVAIFQKIHVIFLQKLVQNVGHQPDFTLAINLYR